ncbi:hypothetical protein [Archangium sp.]|uniref:hypothetical protein n=1 Tax=Archangium sp. TaxID=1872627 RepID=UPI002D3E8D0A|nr:hypothetical protein [Archangium sp.]HYO58868.1 hypothetical protein [Archangium sp.]
MGSEVNSEGLRFLLTQRRHFRAKHGAIQDFMKRIPELSTDEPRKHRSGSGNHITERFIGTIGGDSLSERLGHEPDIPVLNGHSHTEFTKIRLQGRLIDDGCMDTRSTPTIGPWPCLFDNRGELEVAWLIMIDAAPRENWQEHHKPSQGQKSSRPRKPS